MSDKVLAAAISMTSTADLEQNIAIAEAMALEASRLGARWIQFPENVSYIGPYEGLPSHTVDNGSLVFQRFADIARKTKSWLFAGSVAESVVSGPDVGRKVYNTARVFDPQGELRASYRKIHLFNLIDPSGKTLYCESDGMVAGDRCVAVEVDGFRVGLGICYDLRFPEQFLRMSNESPLDVIALPSAFTFQTGVDHWELLLRARAVENQCFVYAANQVGAHSAAKISFGHSMIVDPWGHKLADSGEAPGIAMAFIAKERIQAARKKLPALQNKRSDIFTR